MVVISATNKWRDPQRLHVSLASKATLIANSGVGWFFQITE
jgi:hypothetical protein